MQFSELLYVTLLVTVIESFANEEEENQQLTKSATHNIRKRETIVLYDNFPAEPIYKHKPNIVYRRQSHQRYTTKPKYGIPRTKYRSVKPPRKPLRKYKRPPRDYGPVFRKKRPTKPRYGPPQYSSKPIYGPPKIKSSYFSSEPVGFGEPPNDFYQDYSNPKQSFAEPPEDYMPPKISYWHQQDLNPTESDTETDFSQDNRYWSPHIDTSYDYSNKPPIFISRETQFEPSSPDENNYSYIEHKYKDFPNEEHNLYERRHPYIDDIISAKPKRVMRPKTDDEEVVVGGQYAEPPARVIYKDYTNENPFDEDDEPNLRYADPDVAASATISPYVNYKNSNIAFSPQNLNGAFSIVDKK